MASKSILRAVVERIIGDYDYVEYFASFEIFFTPGIGAGYFDFDARRVLPTGVSHAMKLFEKHFTNRQGKEKDLGLLKKYADEILKNHNNVICDEEKIG